MITPLLRCCILHLIHGPLLFIIYISSLPQPYPGSKFVLYADNILLCCCLRNDIDAVLNWVQTTGFSLKTKLQVIIIIFQAHGTSLLSTVPWSHHH